ncbi:hypothetical protein ACFQH6_08730 [Halobacteriaceae archaeon GCM10025711]
MTVETTVPTDATAATCDRCGRSFPDEELLALHCGLDHADSLDATEREAYEAAYDDEAADLRLFRLKALGALVLLYFGFLFAYSVFS